MIVPALVLAAACSGGEAPPEAPHVMDRSDFIATYVELREVTLLHEDTLTDSLRSAILARHGATEDQLLEFARVWGTDIPFMRDVWEEVEQRLDQRRVPRDSLGP